MSHATSSLAIAGNSQEEEKWLKKQIAPRLPKTQRKMDEIPAFIP
jgi:hypothetical protein